MDTLLKSSRYYRLVLAFFPTMFAMQFGQLSVEKSQALLGGYQVVWSERFGTLLTGWPFVFVTVLLTLLAVASAYATFRMLRVAGLLLGTLWCAALLLGSIQIFSEVHIAPLKVMHLLTLAVIGVILIRGVHRLGSGSQPDKSLERTREG